MRLFARLTRREKLLIVASAIFIALWALFAFTVKPALARMETLKRTIPEKQSELAKLRARSAEYALLADSLADLQAKVASQDEGFELLPFLELTLRDCGLAEKVAKMKPYTVPLGESFRETIVQIQLDNVTLSQLVDFIWKVESSKALVKAKSLHIKRNPTNPDQLDSTFEIHGAKLVAS
jgi:type II secretory pathway component PulM